MKNQKEKIDKCLTCPVAHKFLSEYLSFCVADKVYNKIKDKTKRNLTKRDLEKINLAKRDLKKSIDSLSETLQIEGTYKEKLDFFEKLYKPTLNVDKCYQTLNQISECISSLHSLIYSLKIFFIGSNYPDDDVIELQKQDINKLSLILAVLKKNNIKTAELTKKEKEWSDSFLKSLGFKLSDDDPTNEETEKAINTYNKFRSIVVDYCTRAVGEINYEYCNPFFNNDSSLKNCLEISIKNDNLLGLRLFKLKDAYRSIVYNYLEKAPKKFNKILTKIVEHQELKSLHIAELMSVVDINNKMVKKINSSSIKSLMKSETNKLTDREFTKLKRILLASDELLKCGSGILYGNWNDYLENHNDSKMEETFFKHYETRNYTGTRPKITNDIREFINDDTRFNIVFNDNDLFDSEYISLYASKDSYSGDITYDLEAMYNDLLNPEEFNTLLTVLEELQAQEQE